MKLLFDENLPGSLPQHLADLFPGSVHVRDVGLKQAADSVILEFAVTQGFVIVSKDSDYRPMSALRGHPPKVIDWRVGNCTTATAADLLRRYSATIHTFVLDKTKSLLSLP